MQSNTDFTMLDINLIIPNKYQPRKVFDESALNSLAESIKLYGIINPILVRKKENKYEIIAGERRFRAAKKIGLTEVPVIIKNADEQEIAELALIENIQRQGLSPVEEAKSYEEIMRIGNQTQESLAKKIGKSQAFIANKIRLLSLPQEIQDALANKKISERHARSLITVKNKENQLQLLNRIIKEKLTVKETEEIINNNDFKEDEIKQAISDIMKSLNIKEDEKEDDNMNNGNFFPNFDNNNVMNNNASLNMMNMQSMNQPPIAPEPEVVMPTMNTMVQEPIQMPIQEPVPQMFNPMEQVQPAMQPTTDLNMNNNFNPMANFMVQPDNLMQTPVTQFEQPATMTPELSQFEQQPEIKNENVIMESPIQMIDEPLFNPNIVIPTIEPTVQEPVQMPMQEPIAPVQQPIVEPIPQVEQNQITETPEFISPNTFEIPVVNESPTEPEITIEQDKLTQLQEFLSTNGYQYKTYTSDLEDCIIIELPRN